MFAFDLFARMTGLAFLILLFNACQTAHAQKTGKIKPPSDPVALALMQEYLNSFGDDVYHCKWEYDEERERGEGRKKLHVEGEWSFSAKLGSSYILRHDGIEHIIREVEGSGGRVLSFWPEATKDGQKFRMNLGSSYGNAFVSAIGGGVHGMCYPCDLRTRILEDKWGNPSVFGLESLSDSQAVISLDFSTKEFLGLLTVKTDDGVQAVNKTWKVTNADASMYKMHHGAESETVYKNVRVNKAWLPAEVTYVGRQEEGLLGNKPIFETHRWKLVGEYLVNNDVSRYKKIVPPDGTLFYDELTYTSQRIGGGVGTWNTSGKSRKTQENALVKELQKLPDTPATSTSIRYPTGRLNLYLAGGITLLVIGSVFIAIWTKGLGFRKRDR